jgi:hypothetical protein
VRAIVPAGAAAPDPCSEAEARLRATVAEVAALDAEIEALSAALAEFSRRWERATGDAFAELHAAERLAGRLQRLEDGLEQLAARLRAGELPRRRRRRRRPFPSARPGGPRPAAAEDVDGAGDGPDDVVDEDGAAPPLRAQAEEPADEVVPEEVQLKRLYRRLARVLHPDLAQDEAERARLHDLMAKANAAYDRGDLTALEVMAEKLGAGEPPGDVSAEERLANLERRTATLARIAASLARERERLRRSDTHRLHEEARSREAAGEDWLATTRVELAEEADAAYADARARLARLTKAARDVTRARSVAMKELEKRGPTGARRAFDPLQEAELVRLGAARLVRSRATAEARELARTLEARAGEAPAEVALTLLAFFAEDSGGRPPDALATAEGWAERWDHLRAAWPGTPELARALARLPRWLAVGARAQGDAVVAGPQLADATLAAGVRIALERAAVARLGRAVLAALGPDGRCAACGAEGPGVHVLRTRGLDELHGIVCAGCGAVLRSYWRYGEADGLEALAPHALALGLVGEVSAQLAGTAIGFQMLPAEREALTVAQLRKRFVELYCTPYDVALAPDAIGVAAGRTALAPGARVEAGERLRFTVDRDAGTTAEELLELLRARIERRFRP